MKVVAHRGYAAKYLENTLEALSEAVKAGATMVEFDVQFTKDLTPIMLHDDNFKRTMGLDLSVFEITQRELQGKVELKQISEVEEVVVWLKANPGVKAFVELKQESIDMHGLEVCVNALRESCDPALDQCVFISFNPDSVKNAQECGFKETGWVVLTYDEVGEKISEELSPDYLFADTEILPNDGSKLWEGIWEWVIYEVTSLEVASRLFERGVKIIESKEVEKMLS
ncbi:MAG: glycerophosphodiester phosphodiesterase family protein [Bacteroidetes bacterium]|nr:glycerophosphodiester phosphodiesterase family protein [Bacteroidota bacterium]MDA0980376.1 glycerophosphodiester phosphodiesterase family protein [Bacteroidota bacterium]